MTIYFTIWFTLKVFHYLLHHSNNNNNDKFIKQTRLQHTSV
jgi:hypothetical protein